MRKVFVENLPHNWKGIDWKNTIGYDIDFTYDDISDKLKIIDYARKDNCSKIIIDYYGHKHEIYTSLLKDAKLGSIVGKLSKDYVYNIGDNIVDQNRNITILNKKAKLFTSKTRKENIRGYIFRCNLCGWDSGWIRESSVKYGYGCACCSGKKVVKGINDVATTDPWVLEYFSNKIDAYKYTRNSLKKFRFICPCCKKQSDKLSTIANLTKSHGISCTCSSTYFSKLSKFVKCVFYQLQNQNLIHTIESEVRFSWCKYFNPFKNKETYGIYDYIIDNKYIIEVDGNWHRNDNLLNGQTFKESAFIDSEKDRLAIEHGYIILRISDEFDFKNIVIEKLGSLFLLDNIDWNKCYDYSVKNLQKDLCEYKRNHMETTTTELSEIFHVSPTTVRRWLNFGTKIGWCQYIGQNETQRFVSGRKPLNMRKIICTENGMIFNSGKECSEKSLLLFGVHISRSSISETCSGKRESTHGYHFEYFDN